MRVIRTAGMAITGGLLLALAFGSTASAWSLISKSGNTGDFGTKPASADSPNAPGAKCIYSAADGSGVAHLAWVKVFPFKAIAYDRTGAKDQQPIKFQLTAQRSTDGGTTWKNLGSVSQTRTAPDTATAKFSSLKVAVSGKTGQLYRAIVTLTWLHNGNADGMAKARMEYYGVKWTVGDPAYVYQDACDGAAD